MPPAIDSQRVPSLLAIDVARTLGDDLVPRIAEIVDIARELALEPAAHRDDPEHVGVHEAQFLSPSEAQEFFDHKVIDDFQQLVHDEFIDTAWPAYPLHHRHPMDFDHQRKVWRCPTTGVVVAPLGALPAQ